MVIVYSTVNVKDIFKQGKNYPWSKPEKCPSCKSHRLWGHGYVGRYFEGFNEPLWLKRYRCPDCFAVHTCKPNGFFPGFRYSVKIIIHCILNKLNYGRWFVSTPRQNQQYWFRGLIFQASRYANIRDPTEKTLKELLSNFLIPVSHSIKSEMLLF